MVHPHRNQACIFPTSGCVTGKPIAPPGGKHEYHPVAQLGSQLRHRVVNRSTCNATLWEDKIYIQCFLCFYLLKSIFPHFYGFLVKCNWSLCDICSVCSLKGRSLLDQTKCHSGGVCKRCCSNMDRDFRCVSCKKILYISLLFTIMYCKGNDLRRIWHLVIRVTPYLPQIKLTHAMNHSAGRTNTMSTCYWSKVPRENDVSHHFAPHLSYF